MSFISIERQQVRIPHSPGYSADGWSWIVFDSDFTEQVLISDIYGNRVPFMQIVIDVYEKLNLPVVPNITLFLKWFQSNHDMNVNDYITYAKQYIPKYLKYQKEVQKYLGLL